MDKFLKGVFSIISNKFVILIVIVLILGFLAYKASVHTRVINVALKLIDDRYDKYQKEMELRDKERDRKILEREQAFREREEVLRLQKEELEKRVSSLSDELYKKDITIKNLEVEREKVATKYYSTSDRHAGVKRTIDIGRNLQKRPNP